MLRETAYSAFLLLLASALIVGCGTPVGSATGDSLVDSRDRSDVSHDFSTEARGDFEMAPEDVSPELGFWPDDTSLALDAGPDVQDSHLADIAGVVDIMEALDVNSSDTQGGPDSDEFLETYSADAPETIVDLFEDQYGILGDDPETFAETTEDELDCLPDCAGLFCGVDGCGGTCGVCDDEDYCLGGECLVTDETSLQLTYPPTHTYVEAGQPIEVGFDILVGGGEWPAEEFTVECTLDDEVVVIVYEGTTATIPAVPLGMHTLCCHLKIEGLLSVPCDHYDCVVVKGKMPCEDHVDCFDGNPCSIDACVNSLAGLECRYGLDLENQWCCNSDYDCPCDESKWPNCNHETNTCFDWCPCDNDAMCSDDEECTNDFCSGPYSCTNEWIEGCCHEDSHCPPEEFCGEYMWCQPLCQPDCTDKECGNDGCEGSCGDCDDENPATEDYCTPEEGCTNIPISCSDGDPCTIDTVDPATGSCTTVLISCDDNDPCTIDLCDEVGECFSIPIICDDGDECTVDTCITQNGWCTYAPVCNDDNACTTDLCDAEAGGECTYEFVNCDDENLGTEDSCDEELGCINSSVSCKDGDPCTIDSADPATGYCSNVLMPCVDDDPCTIDLCDQDAGECTAIPKTCDDGDECTSDGCVEQTGVCLNVPVECDDQNPITIDGCNKLSGCTHALACSDNDVCSIPWYDPDTGECNSEPVVCPDDGNACTTSSCNIFTGMCDAVAVSCDDGMEGTLDYCNPDEGCEHVPMCDDNSNCVISFIDPVTGLCSWKPMCDDNDACTIGYCDEATGGCTFEVVDCGDSNFCTMDICDAIDGCQNPTIVDGAQCSVDPNYECVDGQCFCISDCTDKACGDDGCGGSCGECGVGQACVEFGCVSA
jgi:hypothetical protein